MGRVGIRSRPAAKLQPANEGSVAFTSLSPRLCCNKHSHQWVEASVPHRPSTRKQQVSASASICSQCGINPSTYPVHTGLAAKGNYHLQEHSRPSVLEQDIPRAKSRWQTKASFRSVSPKPLHTDSRPKDGAFRENLTECLAVNVGNNPRHNRCVSSGPDSKTLQEIFLFPLQRSNFHVLSNAFWLDNSALGLFEINETNQIISKEIRSHGKFFHRRLSKLSGYERPSNTAQFMDQVSADLAWLQNKREKVSTNTLSSSRIPGCGNQFQGVNNSFTRKQSDKSVVINSSVNRLSNGNAKTTGVTGRTSNVRPQNDAIGQNVHKQSDYLAESVHPGVLQGHSGKSQPSVASSPSTFQKPVNPDISIIPACDTLPDFNDGRLRVGLVGGPSTLQGQRCLDMYGTFKLHKRPRVNGHVQNSIFLQGFPSGHPNQNSYRQHGYFVLSKENGFISFNNNDQYVQEISFVVSRVQHPVCCRPHRRGSQCSSRQGFTSGSHKHRENVGPGYIIIHMGNVQIKPMARRIRYTGYFEMSVLRFSVPGSQSLRHRCLSSRLEQMDIPGRKHLFFPASCIDAFFSRKVCGFQRPCHLDSSVQWSYLASTPHEASRQSLSASEGLLPISTHKGQIPHSQKEVREISCISPYAQGLAQPLVEHPVSLLSYKQIAIPAHILYDELNSQHLVAPLAPSFPTSSLRDNGESSQQSSAPIPTHSNEMSSQQPEILNPNLSIPFVRNVGRTGDSNVNRLEVCFNEIMKLGYSPDAARLISNSHKASTQNQYQSGWKLWLAYLDSFNISNEEVTAVTFCNFLAYHGVQIDRALSTVKVYFYAIRKPFKLVYHTDLPAKEDLDNLFNGLYHLKPPPTKEQLAPKWNLTSLLKFLRSDNFEPLQSVSFKMVEIKAFILILLATGRRVGEISKTAFDSVTISDEKVELGWFPNFKAKAQRSNSSWRPENPSFFALRGAPDDLLCPVRAFRTYYELRCTLPEDAYGGYLWTHKLKQISDLVRDTIIESLKQFQPDLFGVPNLLVRVHQIRKFAISLAKKFLRLSDKELCKFVGSRTIAVPYRKYISVVPKVTLDCQIPGGSLNPSNINH